MTHDKALKVLRELGSPIGDYGLMTKSDAQDIAELLGLYRDTLIRVREGIEDYNEEFGSTMDTSAIDEVLV